MTPAVWEQLRDLGEFPAVDGSSTMRRNIPKGQAPVFGNLVAQAALIKAAAALLVEEAGSEIAPRSRIAAAIRELEISGDSLVRENAAFLTRESVSVFSRLYEPEDLRTLSSRLDDILDAIEEAAFRLSAYQCTWLVVGIPQSCVFLRNCAEAIHRAIEDMAHGGEPSMACSEIPALANRAGELLRESRRDIFSSDAEALLVFTNKEICDTLDQAVTFCTSAVKQLHIMETSCA
jgi:uncharacterized protein Yka (UPF0111/DUF47 family)